MVFFPTKIIGQSDGASRWRVCYQRGLPRLVYIYFEIFRFESVANIGIKHSNIYAGVLVTHSLKDEITLFANARIKSTLKLYEDFVFPAESGLICSDLLF